MGEPGKEAPKTKIKALPAKSECVRVMYFIPFS